jgi:tRNA threonylcarbamoyl adenosine modification protein (Sua5/YciO/YrdC/YwlC family)
MERSPEAFPPANRARRSSITVTANANPAACCSGSETMLISINPLNPQMRLIGQVVEILRRGGVIAYPTDTYYGIGCDIMNKKAIQRVYGIKQRRASKPFSFICSDLKNISDYAKVSNYAYKTMRRLLPGPYTFILEGSKLVPKTMLTKRKTAGIRVPENRICIDMVRELGNPILTTSAQFPDETPLPDPSLIHDYLGSRIDIVIDGGPVPNSPSSVISLIDDIPEIIRRGMGDVSSFE